MAVKLFMSNQWIGILNRPAVIRLCLRFLLVIGLFGGYIAARQYRVEALIEGPDYDIAIGKTSDISLPTDRHDILKKVRIDLMFAVENYSLNDNLLQTSDLNNGIRIELQSETKAILYVATGDGSLRSAVLSKNLVPKHWHHLSLQFENNNVTAWLKKKPVSFAPPLEHITPSFSNLRFGAGYSEDRLFQGKIKNIRIMAHYQPLAAWGGAKVILCLLLLLLAETVIYLLPGVSLKSKLSALFGFRALIQSLLNTKPLRWIGYFAIMAFVIVLVILNQM